MKEKQTHRSTLLVIDDEKEFRSLLKSQLEDSGGYRVITAGNGREGVSKAKDESPDLVICDIKMPEKNGHEVLSELRKNNYKGPFIMLSALSDFDNIRQAYDEEADFYIAKPVQLEMLLRNIHTLLSLAEQKKSE